MKKIIIAHICLLLSIFATHANKICTTLGTSAKYSSAGKYEIELNGVPVIAEFMVIRSNTEDEGRNEEITMKSGIFTEDVYPKHNGPYCYMKMITPIISKWAYVGVPDEKGSCSSFLNAVLNFFPITAKKKKEQEKLFGSFLTPFDSDAFATMKKDNTCPSGFRNISYPIVTIADDNDSCSQISLGKVAACSSGSTTDTLCKSFDPKDTYLRTNEYSDDSGTYTYSQTCYVFDD